MSILNSPIPFPMPAEAQVEMSELSHWSKFQLDFIIAGLDNCGTTSLGRWLNQVDSIEFSRFGEEDHAGQCMFQMGKWFCPLF